MTLPFAHFLVALIAVINPIGNSAVFLSLTHERTPAERNRVAIIATLGIFVTLSLMSWAGSYVLEMFGISIGDFQTAGGLALLLIGLAMFQSKKKKVFDSHQEEEHLKEHKMMVAIIPLTIPLLAGPGAIAAVMVYAATYSTFADRIAMTGAIGIAALVVSALLLSASFLARLIGKMGMKVIVRLSGLVLMAIAVEMLSQGIHRLISAW